MSKNKSELSQDEINESFDESLKKGEVTDLMGNELTEKDFISISKKVSVWDTVGLLKPFQGKILTIIDASYDGTKSKYVKDLIKGEFVRFADNIIEINRSLTNSSQSNPLNK